MSFGAPLWLLALALIPLALVAVPLTRRRARRYALRYPSVASVQVVLAAQRSASWTRQLPVAALLLALAAASLALARPRIHVRVPVGEASVVLVTDHSGSMASTDVQPTRLGAAIAAANTFLSQIPSNVRIGSVTFSTTPDAAQAPVAQRSVVRGIIDSQTPNGGTDTGPALQLALQLLHGTAPHHPPSAIVLLSDGAANLGISPLTVASQARQERIPIYTVALGTPDGVLNVGPLNPPVPVPPDPQLMDAIARVSGGRTFTAESADQLSSIYKRLGNQFGTALRRRDITADFAVAGAVLLVVGLGTTMLVGGRVP